MRILRGLTSRLLPCGCIAGVYEAYTGEIVTLLDDRQPHCANPDHSNGNELPELNAVARREANEQRSSQK